MSESRSSPVTWSLEIVDDARDVRPDTVKVPFDVNEDVAVIDPLVSDEKIEVIPERRVAKKLVDVALVVDALVAANVVAVALVALNRVSVADADVRSEIVVVASVAVERTTSLPVVVAFPEASTTNAELAVQAEPFQ